MKLIIDIEKDYYENLKYNVEQGQKYKPWEIIANGIPYGEGLQYDLISRSELKKAFNWWWGCDDIPSSVVKDLIDDVSTVETTKAEHKAYNEGFKDGVDQGIKLSASQKGECITKMKLINADDLKEYAQKLLVGERINTYFGINLYKMFEEIINHTPAVSDRYDEGYAQGYIDGSTGADWRGE